MNQFIKKHSDKITGTLNCFDRVIIKGYLPLCYPQSFQSFLNNKGILLKDLKSFLPSQAQRIKEHTIEMANATGRPFIYINDHRRKQEQALEIAKKDKINRGLICIYSVLEPCRSFKVVYSPGRPQLQAAQRKCLFYYFYYMDQEFGLIHVRLQSWFPFTIQVYVNGHEWLARKLDQHRIEYKKRDNAFLWISDVKRAQQFADQMAKKKWPRVLDSLARRTNPLLGNLLKNLSYYWVVDQAEFATDVMFRDKSCLDGLYEKLLKHSTFCFSAEDVLTFLGKKMHGNFQGDVTSRYKKDEKRFPGARIKHQVKRNALKMYNKEGSCLRVETVINNPYEFKVRRKSERDQKTHWKPMRKGISYLYAYAEKGLRSNARYLDALEPVGLEREISKSLDQICEKKKIHGRSIGALNPVAKKEVRLFRVILRGEYHINGFRNHDIRERLFQNMTTGLTMKSKQSSQITRLFNKLHAHGLIAKIPRTRRWRTTNTGQTIMSTSILLREKGYDHMI
jgi:hypothetical protein